MQTERPSVMGVSLIIAWKGVLGILREERYEREQSLF